MPIQSTAYEQNFLPKFTGKETPASYNGLVIKKKTPINRNKHRLKRTSVLSPGWTPVIGPILPAAQEEKPSCEATSASANGTYDPILLYLREVGQTPLLTIIEERKLARKVRKGDDKARERMILANLRLVVHIARGYANKGLPMSDLINEGNIGLMKALEKYNPRRAKFSTYASWWIKQHMMRALTNQIRSIRLPVHIVERLTKLRRAEASLQEKHKRDPTPEEIAEALSIPASQVRRLISAAANTSSLDAPIGEGEAGLAELMPDEKALSPAEAAEQKSSAEVIHKLLAELPQRERIILEYRFGFDGGKGRTLEETGQQFGITRERIRQIQAELVKRLRRSIEKLENPQKIALLRERVALSAKTKE